MIVFIGGGNMASAIAGGLIARGRAASGIAIVDPVEAQRARLAASFPGVRTHAATDADAIAGATIVAAMLMGTSKRAAAEFSFFLAMPTMAGAFAYDLYKSYGQLDAATIRGIALGFVVSFVAGVFVVRYLLDYVSRHGFALFAWWRIIVGGLGLAGLMMLG